MDMKEIVQNIDTDAIAARNLQIEQKLDDAIEYTRDIKTGLRDDILAIEKQADRAEDKVRTMENEVRDMIDKASERFETKRDAMKADSEQDMEDLEDRLEKKLQRALDNPLLTNLRKKSLDNQPLFEYNLKHGKRTNYN